MEFLTGTGVETLGKSNTDRVLAGSARADETNRLEAARMTSHDVDKSQSKKKAITITGTGRPSTDPSR
jgi:hypothetical protein